MTTKTTRPQQNSMNQVCRQHRLLPRFWYGKYEISFNNKKYVSMKVEALFKF